jgi:peptidoglycan/LPS O-acetylase OafA/YrhL
MTAGTALGIEPRERRAVFEYRPALDGLRAVAVVLVLTYHNTSSHGQRLRLVGGFLGVDIFFVLSGYLITSLILAERQSNGRVDLRAFWERRIRRLLPALCVMLVVVAAFAEIVAEPMDLAAIRGNALATLLYAQNWHTIAADALDPGGPLAHTWSLSVEEQWYLVWPIALAVLLAWQRSSRRRVFVIASFLAVASALWTYLLFEQGAGLSRVYQGTDTRAQELLVGAALAILLAHWKLSDRGSKRAGRLAVVAAFLIAVFVATMKPGSPFLARGGYLFFAVCVAVVIVAVVQPVPAGVVGGLLSIPILRMLGIISYGVYLYHLPMYVWLTPERIHVTGVNLLAVRLLVTIAAAVASFFLIERPVRGRMTRARSLAAIAVAMLVALVAIVVATREQPVPSLLSNDAVASYAQIGTNAKGIRVLVIGEAAAFQLAYEGGVYKTSRVTGTSFGLLDCGLVAGYLESGKRVVPEPRHCADRLHAFSQLADAFHPDVLVLMPEGSELFDRYADGRKYRIGTRSWADYISRELDATRRAASSQADPQTIVVATPCEFSPTGTKSLDVVLESAARRRTFNDLMRAYAASRSSTTRVVDPFGASCGAEATVVVSRPADASRARTQQFWAFVATQATEMQKNA